MNDAGEAGVLTESSSKFSTTAWIVLAIVLVVTSAARWRLLPVVLERDEGEFAYMGQLLLEGVPPYKEAANLKWPGIYAAYAVGMAVFGQTTQGVHLTLLVVNLTSIVLMFLLARKIGGDNAAAMASATFAVLSFSPHMVGFAAHATHFVVAATLAGLYLLLRALDGGGRLGIAHSGLWLGIAALMKQPGLAFSALAGVLVIESAVRHKPFSSGRLISKLSLLFAGVAAPILVSFLALYMAGVWDSFWLWTVEYAPLYGAYQTRREMLDNLHAAVYGALVLQNQPLLALAAFGATTPWWSPRMRSRKVLVVSFLFFSVLAVCPGFVFRSHYFILLIPVLSLCCGMAIAAFVEDFSWIPKRRNREDAGVVLALACLLWPVYSYSRFVLDVSPERVSQAVFKGNPFTAAPTIADFLREHSTPEDRIAILGSEPEILFYAHRRSATSFLYTYSLMELHPLAARMQEMMIADVEAAQPKFIVWVNVQYSWLQRPESDVSIHRWAEKYLVNHYKRVAALRLDSGQERNLLTGSEAANVDIAEPNTILIFERKVSH